MKKKRLVILIIVMLMVIIVGTFAWATFRTKKSSLVLVLGDTDSLQITLYPYELKIVAAPVQTYTSEMPVTVTASNNKNAGDTFSLYYDIKSIDNALRSTSMKYAVTKSVNNSTYTQVASGNFSSATNNSVMTILEETIPAHTTYDYKVYTYLESNGGNQSSMQGKILETSLSADIDS